MEKDCEDFIIQMEFWEAEAEANRNWRAEQLTNPTVNLLSKISKN